MELALGGETRCQLEMRLTGGRTKCGGGGGWSSMAGTNTCTNTGYSRPKAEGRTRELCLTEGMEVNTDLYK